MTLNTLEQNARRAKEANSFSNYRAGSATAEYNEYCKNAEDVATWVKERLTKSGAPAERTERVDYLLSLYKAKKLSWLNDLYSVRARVPSVMIAGPANFPVRAKQKQVAREDSLMKQNPDSILDEIRGIGHNSKTIYSDDKNAVERIKEKIESLKGMPDPYGNKSAEIRRLKGRLLQLAPEEFAEQQAHITVNGAKSYDEIVALWNSGELKKSTFVPSYDPEPRWYFYLYIDFYNGKRHYKELLNIEIDETGENVKRYNHVKGETESVPLTDTLKYSLIISKINGSGNKAIIFQHLKSLTPKAQSKTTEEEGEIENASNTVTINGETAQVVRNKEEMRLQLIFDGKPGDATRKKLKSNGFRWAPSCTAWQRLLNSNAEWALKMIADK
ncbi:MAG: hypothetical protein VB106_05275 [Clostridiaceae bacterium]|nr:hypothetical protein [Clostridiaceae bacterium]